MTDQTEPVDTYVMKTARDYACAAEDFWDRSVTQSPDQERYHLDAALIHAQLATAAANLEAAGRHPSQLGRQTRAERVEELKRALCDTEWINGGWAQIDGILEVLLPIIERQHQ